MVRNVIRESRCDFVCQQETKWNNWDLNYVFSLLPSFFQSDCMFINALNSRGGCLISWKRQFQLRSAWATKHTISVLLTDSNTGQQFIITNTYGLSVDDQKNQYLRELKKLAATINHPWIIAGDFNLARWLTDRTGDMRGISLMCSFNDLITDLALMEVSLKNKSYTWSKHRPQPSFSKIDRVFVTGHWESHFPVTLLTALESTASDHSPLLLVCKQLQTQPKQYRLERFWFNFDEVKLMVNEVWSRKNSLADAVQFFDQKVQQMHKNLRDWHCKNHGFMATHLENSKKAILMFDQIEEKRGLSEGEFQLRLLLRQRAFRLAFLTEIRWSQRARCRWLREGDNNTRYFHAYASSRMRRNQILSLNYHVQTLTNIQNFKEAFLAHMTSILGTETPVQQFNPSSLYPNPNPLTNLQNYFSLQEIEEAMFNLAKNKASGPDGLPNEFTQLHWQDIKKDLVEIIESFQLGQVNLQILNRANILMIPKEMVQVKLEISIP